MTLEIKYPIGTEVYCVFKEDDEMVRVFKDKVIEVAYSEKNGLNYFGNMAEPFKEEELIPVNQPNLLTEKIESLLKED